MNDWIELSSFTIDCVLGVLDGEQRGTQPLEVDLRLGLNLEDAANGDLAQTVDYAAVADIVTTLAQQGRWRLLESLGTAVCRALLAPPGPQEERAQVAEVEVRLRKPAVLGGAAVPGVGLRRNAAWCDLKTTMFVPRVWLDTLVETPLAGAYRIHLEPGVQWRPPVGLALHVLAGRPLLDGRPLFAGDKIARGLGKVLENSQEKPVTLLGVATPSLSP